MKIVNALVAVVALSSGVAFASGKKVENCDLGHGKKTHVKNEKACAAKKGTWIPADAAAAAPAAAPAPEAAAPAPAAGEHQ